MLSFLLEGNLRKILYQRMNVYLMIFLSRLFAFSLISMSLFRLPAEGYDIFITRMANHSPNILLALPNANDI